MKIFLIILLIIALILLIDISVIITYNNEAIVYLKIFLFKFKIYPKKTQKQKDKSEKKAKSNNDKKGSSKIKGLLKSFDFIKNIIKSILSAFKVKRFELDMIVATGDPADTAILFGAANAGVYGLLSFLKNKIKVKNEKINIGVNYDDDKSKIKCYIRVSTNLLKLILTLILNLKYVIIYKNKDMGEK